MFRVQTQTAGYKFMVIFRRPVPVILSVSFLPLQSVLILAFSPALNQSFDSCELILFITGLYGSVPKGSCYNL
jgi:hypothetical protein